MLKKQLKPTYASWLVLAVLSNVALLSPWVKVPVLQMATDEHKMFIVASEEELLSSDGEDFVEHPPGNCTSIP